MTTPSLTGSVGCDSASTVRHPEYLVHRGGLQAQPLDARRRRVVSCLPKSIERRLVLVPIVVLESLHELDVSVPNVPEVVNVARLQMVTEPEVSNPVQRPDDEPGVDPAP